MYKVIFKESVKKELGRLQAKIVSRIFPHIENLSADPRPPGSKKLKGKDGNFYRIRIGDYRVIYFIDDGVKLVSILRVAHRKEVYD